MLVEGRNPAEGKASSSHKWLEIPGAGHEDPRVNTVRRLVREQRFDASLVGRPSSSACVKILSGQNLADDLPAFRVVLHQ